MSPCPVKRAPHSPVLLPDERDRGAARVRIASPPAGTASHSAVRSALMMASHVSEMAACNINGDDVNGKVTKVIGWTTAAVIAVLNAYLVWTTLFPPKGS